MAGATKLMTASGGGVILTPATNIAADVTVQVPSVNGTVLIPGQASALTSGTAQASTSGTSIDFTGIPSWVKRITVMFNEVSLSGTSSYLIQIGAGSFESTGYVSTSISVNNANGTGGLSSTAGFVIRTADATRLFSGHVVITNISGSIWIESHTGKLDTTNGGFGGGSKTITGTLDRIRITTANGTDTFDAGSINILYE